MAQTTKLTNYKSSFDYDANGHLVIKCHKTIIVDVGQHNTTLKTGGCKTKKTKDDMNRASSQFNLGFKVFQKKRAWYVDCKNPVTGEIQTFPFDEDVFTIYR